MIASPASYPPAPGFVQRSRDDLTVVRWGRAFSRVTYGILPSESSPRPVAGGVFHFPFPGQENLTCDSSAHLRASAPPSWCLRGLRQPTPAPASPAPLPAFTPRSSR